MSSVARIQSALEKTFARQRIAFWYDADGEWWPEFEALQLSGVEKLSVENNEFGIKHRIARDQPKQSFLLYFRGQPQPPDAQNWLLDQLLAHGGSAFSPDRASLAQIDAGLAPEFKTITTEHLDFFRSNERTTKLRDMLGPDDADQSIRLKMLAVTCRCEPTTEAILLVLLGELAKTKNDRMAEVEKYGLTNTLWRELNVSFGYSSLNPTLLDLCLCLFRTAVSAISPGSKLDARQVAMFFGRWKDSQIHRDSFVSLSERAGKLVNIGQSLNAVDDVLLLLNNDTYRLIDQKVVTALRDNLVERTLAPADVRRRAEQRITLFWARQEEGLMAIYRAIVAAADFTEGLVKLDLTMESAEAGVKKYSETWWRLDYLYRLFLHQRSSSGQSALLEKLSDWLEGQYLNSFLGPLAVNWQEWIDRMPAWGAANVVSQGSFHSQFVLPHISAGRKVLVIISDALRFEAGKELAQRIITEDRWSANVQPMLGVLPSYTQLGMAALLPHTSLTIEQSGTNVLVDNAPSNGADKRDKILRNAHGGRAGVISTEDFLALNSKVEGRELFRDHEVIYVYHNAIDAVGDKRDTEHETCAAVEKALVELVRMLKKAAAINFSTMIVTADHGFLYQEKSLEEADFLSYEGKVATDMLHRRFVIGGVSGNSTQFRTFTYEQLGLTGSGQVAFPKGIQRLRKQGAGSRYVHGGTSLQEVIVPVIEVRKERASDTTQAGVDIVRTSQQITSGQVAITLVQTEPVGEKCLPTELRVGFYAKSGELISETKNLRFESKAEDIRQRERVERFLFSREADRFNNQDVLFRMEEFIPGSNQYSLKQEYVFRLKRAFESDFDDV